MAFECPDCQGSYEDPLYHGPAGHAPQELCLECWAYRWEVMETIIESERGNWRMVDLALYLLCQDYTQGQVARKLGVHRNTIRNWLDELREHPEGIPDWLCNRGAADPRRKDTEARDEEPDQG